MMNPQALYDFICHQWQEEIIPSLSDYIKIPNKSPHFDAKWQEHGFMDQAVEHIASWCKNHAPEGMNLQIKRLEGRTPLLFIDIPGNIQETVLVYGHLDKQPEMSGWSEGLHPWKPVLKNGRLYGRGVADDGYCVYAALTAICALQKQGLAIPRCVLIIESCEESGSYDLPYYMELLHEEIGQPSLVLCLDSGAGNYEQLWMTTSLRGHVAGELSVELIREGVHSGAASGIVADSFRVARGLISRIEDEVSGEVKLPQLYCTIPEERKEQAQQCATILCDSVHTEFPWHDGVVPASTDREQLILNKTWRPALTVTGAGGFPAIADAGNVMRAQTVFKLSMRLPPLVNANSAATVLHDELTKTPPYQAKVHFKLEGTSQGWNAPECSSWLKKTTDAASLFYYGKPAAFMGEGGTIPFMSLLGEQFPDAQFMITGVLGPQSNAHGPNEFLHLDMVKKLSACVAYVIGSLQFNDFILGE